MGERGSVTLIVAVTLGLAGMLATLTVDAARAAATRTRAQAIADAAALAAAQELVIPSGRSPAEVAREYAGTQGARLTRCRCSLGSTDVELEVELEVRLPTLARTRSVRAAARAVAAVPFAADGLRAFFIRRLGCLFDRVGGLAIVSGFRTFEEQARLHRARPDLAAPPGRSNHERGLAADLSFSSDAARHEAHRTAPACGLTFPVAHEPWHVEPAAPG